MGQLEITQEYLDKLIITPKRIVKKPKKDYLIKNGSRRRDFQVYSDKYKESFRVFIRQSEALAECFSIGLQLLNPLFDEAPILFRCNGPHGGNDRIKEHFVTHIHRCKLEVLDDMLFSIEKTIEPTDAYTTFDSAIYYFLTTCNILDAKQYFERSWNVTLFE